MKPLGSKGWLFACPIPSVLVLLNRERARPDRTDTDRETAFGAFRLDPRVAG
jgi:hypothetical protein